jgi:hypothetical protein
MVILELVGGTRSESEYRELCEDLEALQQCPITESVWRSAYRMTYTLRRKGLSIPATDQLIAAVAVHYSCSLLHCDNHFDLLARHVRLPVYTPQQILGRQEWLARLSTPSLFSIDDPIRDCFSLRSVAEIKDIGVEPGLESWVGEILNATEASLKEKEEAGEERPEPVTCGMQI